LADYGGKLRPSYFRLPQITSAIRDALTPALGMIIYNTTTSQYERYNGTDWETWGGDATYKLAPSFTVYKTNSTYYAMDSDGNILQSGSNPTTVIQAALTQIHNNDGGLLFLKEASYSITDNLEIGDNTLLMGVGPATKLVLSSGKYLRVTSKNNVRITNLFVDATGHVTNDAAIRICNSNEVCVDHVKVDAQGFGVYAFSTAGNTCRKITVSDSILFGHGNNDIIGGGPQDNDTQAMSEILIKNNVLKHTTDASHTYDAVIALTQGYRYEIVDNIAEGSITLAPEQWPHTYTRITGNVLKPAEGKSYCHITVWAASDQTSFNLALEVANNVIEEGQIRIYGSSSAWARQCNVTDNVIFFGTEGVLFEYATCCKAEGNVINACSQGVYLKNTNHITVSDNMITNCTTGIYETDSDFNYFHDNMFQGNTTNITKAGASTRVRDNYGYVTENNGTATITSGDTYVDVTHGLDVIPSLTKIQLVPLDNLSGRSLWVSNASSSTFRINISSIDSVDHNIGWSYKE